MKPRKILTSQKELDAYIHRTRMEMVRILCERPASVSELGTEMNVHPANLSRHMKILEQAGLIELIERRDTGRATAKIYSSVARGFDLAPDLEQVTAPHKLALGFARSDMSAALERLPETTNDTVFVKLGRAHVPLDRVLEFFDELSALHERFSGLPQEPDADAVHLMIALYPGGEKPPHEEFLIVPKGGKNGKDD
jgi:DNA-binding transcriptional ArsR family regulator